MIKSSTRGAILQFTKILYQMDSQPKRPNRISILPDGATLEKSQEFFSCSYPDCDYKSNWEENVGRHEWNHNPTGLDCDIPCQVCPQVFGYLVSFFHHMTSKHSNKLFCPWCFFLGEDLTEFKAHMLAHILKPQYTPAHSHECIACSKSFALRRTLLEHQKHGCALNLSTPSATNIQDNSGGKNSLENSTGTALQCDPKNADSFKAQGSKPISKNTRRVKPKKSLSTLNEDGEVEKIPSTKMDFRCGNCPKTYLTKQSLLKHQKNICPSALLGCDKCSYRTSFPQDLRKHVTIHLAGEQLKCRRMGYDYTTLWTQSLRKNQQSCKIPIPGGVSKSIDIPTEDIKINEGKTEYSCGFCSFKSKSRALLKRHFLDHLGRKPLRRGRKARKYEAKQSQTLPHPIRRDHPRKVPKSTLQTEENLGLHMELEIKTEEDIVQIHNDSQNSLENSKVEESKLTLDNNDCSSNNPDTVQTETVVEVQRTTLDSDNCNLTTLNGETLDTHGRIHASEKPFKCPNVGCAFMTRWAKGLRHHQRSCESRIPAQTFDHAAVGRIKTEGTTETLMEKEKAIDGDTLFHCSLCSFKSKWKPSLKAHLRVHDDHQPFRCPIEGCKYRTKWSSELRKHFRILHHIQLPSKTSVQTEDNSGSDRELKIEGFVSSTTITFACVLCEFIGYSQLAALKHSCEHKTAVISLNRI